MKSLAYIPASNQAANASQMTVQSVRSPGASDILVNTVTGAPTKFYGSMGAPHTFTDPVTGETITIISEATAVDFAGHLDTGKVVIDAIAPGYVDTRGSLVGDIVVIRPVTEWANNIFNVLSEAHNDDGTLKETAVTYQPLLNDCIQTGGVWSIVSGLNAAMTAMTSGYITGRKNVGAVAALASRAFTASKDTYVDLLRNTTTGVFTVVYTEVANNAASPALAANSLRLAIVVTGASTITYINQGDTFATLPAIANIPLAVCDTIGNLIYPRPGQKILGFRMYPVGAGPTINSASPAEFSSAMRIPILASNVPNGGTIKAQVASRSAATSAGVWDVYVALNAAAGQTILDVSGSTASVPLNGTGVARVLANTVLYLVGQSTAGGNLNIQAYNSSFVFWAELD